MDETYVVLGLDTGSQKAGVAVIQYWRQARAVYNPRVKYLMSLQLKTKARAPYLERVRTLTEELEAFVEAYHFQYDYLPKIEVAVVETTVLGGRAGVKSALQLGVARGAFYHTLWQCGIARIDEIHPGTLKKHATGTGRADKALVQRVMRDVFQLDAVPDEDEADALAAAYAWCMMKDIEVE